MWCNKCKVTLFKDFVVRYLYILFGNQCLCVVNHVRSSALFYLFQCARKLFFRFLWCAYFDITCWTENSSFNPLTVSYDCEIQMHFLWCIFMKLFWPTIMWFVNFMSGMLLRYLAADAHFLFVECAKLLCDTFQG